MEMEHYKELWGAVKREFSRFRAWCALLFAVVLIGVLCAGMFWPKAYETDTLVYIDSANIIEPLMDGRAAVSNEERAEQAQKLLYTRSVLTATAQAAGLLSEDATAAEREEMIKRLRQSITVEAEGDSYFRISYWDRNPERSYNVVNALVETFIGNRSNARQTESAGAYNFINSQVQVYKQQLEEAERMLQEHKANSSDTTEAAVRERIANIKAEMQALRVAIQETESRIATTRELLQDEDQHLTAQSQAGELLQRRRELKNELEQLRLAYQESYPDIVAIRRQIAEIDTALASMDSVARFDGATGETGGTLFEDLRSQLSVAEVELKSQRRRLETLQNVLAEEVQLADKVAAEEAREQKLQRDYNVIVDVYEELLTRQESAKLSVALNETGESKNYEVLEQPVYPLEPGGPQFVHFAVAAPILGLGAPLGLLLAFIMADPRIRSTTTLAQSTPPEIEIMGVVPHFESPAEKRAARAEIAMLTIFCAIAIIAYGLLVYAGFNGIV